MGKSKMSYEEAVARLEQLSENISNFDKPMSQIEADVKEAGVLIEYCKKLIKETEEEIAKIATFAPKS